MVRWTVTYKGEAYAVFVFDNKLRLKDESTRAKADGLKELIRACQMIFDPRSTKYKHVNIFNLKDKYEADLFLRRLFTPNLISDYSIESRGLDWSKVLEKPKPGIFY